MIESHQSTLDFPDPVSIMVSEVMRRVGHGRVGRVQVKKIRSRKQTYTFFVCSRIL